MLTTKLFWVVIVALALRPLAHAEGGDRNGAMFEIGASLGTPAAGNAVLGLWGPSGFPLLLRASGMYYTKATHGAQAEFGLITNRSADLVTFVSAIGITSDIGGKKWTGAGGGFGLIWHRLSFDLGLTAGRGDFTSPQLVFQIGFSFL